MKQSELDEALREKRLKEQEMRMSIADSVKKDYVDDDTVATQILQEVKEELPVIIKYFDKQENIKGEFTDVSLFEDFIIKEYKLSIFSTENFLETPIKEFLDNCKEATYRFEIEYEGLPDD